MAWLAPRPGNRQAQDRHRLAPQGVQAFLDMEVAAEKAGPTTGVEGDPPSGPTDVAGEHTVGRTSDPWRAFEGLAFPSPRPPSRNTWSVTHRRHRSRGGHSLQITPIAWRRSISSWSPRPRSTSCFGFIVLHHERRQIVHFGVTANPTMAWVAQQIREAFPWGTAPRYLIRDRDGAYGQSFRSTVTAMGVEEVVTAPRSPWQNPYVERLIGSVRRECLDHSIILNERHLRRILGSYLDYYHGSRTHLSLGKDTPDGRPVQPAGSGTVVSLPKVGGLHHRYERLAA